MPKKITKDSFVVLTSAYGRNPKTAEEVIALFKSGKDFQSDIRFGFAYCSIRDFPPGSKAELRFNGLEDLVIVEVLTNGDLKVVYEDEA